MGDVRGLTAPIGLLAELTHRCPLGCPYCSNPLALERREAELDTATWMRVFNEAAQLGVMQVHLSGGEPGARRDLVKITASAREAGLYTNLITSGIGITARTIQDLSESGLDHSRSRSRTLRPYRLITLPAIAARSSASLRWRPKQYRLGLPLTINAVVHRGNIARIREMVDLAIKLKAKCVEIAHAQYYGWALKNRAALMPTREQVDRAMVELEEVRQAQHGHIVIDAVLPDYYARFPKPCVGGWGRRSLNVTPSGRVLPCHAADRSQVSSSGMFAIIHWARSGLIAGLQCIPRDDILAGAVRKLRAAGDRFRWLSLPGLCVDRGCARD